MLGVERGLQAPPSTQAGIASSASDPRRTDSFLPTPPVGSATVRAVIPCPDDKRRVVVERSHSLVSPGQRTSRMIQLPPRFSIVKMASSLLWRTPLFLVITRVSSEVTVAFRPSAKKRMSSLSMVNR